MLPREEEEDWEAACEERENGVIARRNVCGCPPPGCTQNWSAEMDVGEKRRSFVVIDRRQGGQYRIFRRVNGAWSILHPTSRQLGG